MDHIDQSIQKTIESGDVISEIIDVWVKQNQQEQKDRGGETERQTVLGCQE